MCNLVRIFTILGLAVGAYGFNIQSVFPLAELGPNMYVKPINVDPTCKDIFLSIEGCISCLGDCMIKNGQNITMIISCIPPHDLTQVLQTTTLEYPALGLSTSDPDNITYNCAANQPCELYKKTEPLDAPFLGEYLISVVYNIGEEILAAVEKCKVKLIP